MTNEQRAEELIKKYSFVSYYKDYEVDDEW